MHFEIVLPNPISPGGHLHNLTKKNPTPESKVEEASSGQPHN